MSSHKTIDWIQKQGLKTNKGLPIEFHDHGFLWDYINDESSPIVTRKCTQVGISFATELKILKAGDENNLSIIYTLPTGGDVKDFVLSKFDPVIESSPTLSKKVYRDPLSRRAVFSTVLKRIGGSHYFFRGSFAEHKAQTIDGDILVVDELDFQKPEVRAMYEERLGGSGSSGSIYYIGTPTLPNYGISELYDRSDQRQWHIKCPACGRLQTLDWPANISFHKRTFICKYCRADLSDNDRRKGRWIPMNSKAKMHGYHFNRLMAPWISASKLIDLYNKDKIKHFYNFSLGLPYLEKTLQFTNEDFEKTFMFEKEFEVFKKEKLVLGIDQGNNFHIVLGYVNPMGGVVTRASRIKDPTALEKLISDLNPDLIVMDMYPDQHYAKGLQLKYGNDKILLINQRTWTDPNRINKFIDFHKGQGIINLERTEALDSMFDRLKNNSLRLLASMIGRKDLFEHIRNLIPDYQDRFGRQKKVYKKIGQEDLAHALDYFQIGSQILFPDSINRPIQIVNSVYQPTFTKSTREWANQDFENYIKKASIGGSDIAVIPPV